MERVGLPGTWKMSGCKRQGQSRMWLSRLGKVAGGWGRRKVRAFSTAEAVGTQGLNGHTKESGLSPIGPRATDGTHRGLV